MEEKGEVRKVCPETKKNYHYTIENISAERGAWQVAFFPY